MTGNSSHYILFIIHRCPKFPLVDFFGGVFHKPKIITTGRLIMMPMVYRKLAGPVTYFYTGHHCHHPFPGDPTSRRQVLGDLGLGFSLRGWASRVSWNPASGIPWYVHVFFFLYKGLSNGYSEDTMQCICIYIYMYMYVCIYVCCIYIYENMCFCSM